jgi:hypothetical protein
VYDFVISKNVSYLLCRLSEAQASSVDGEIVNIAPYVHRYTFDAMADVIFGEPICSQPHTDTTGSRDVLTSFRDMSKFAWGAAYLPWFGWAMSTRLMVYLTRRPTYNAEGNTTGLAALATQTRERILSHPDRVRKSSQPSILKNYLSVPESDTKHMTPIQIWREF